MIKITTIEVDNIDEYNAIVSNLPDCLINNNSVKVFSKEVDLKDRPEIKETKIETEIDDLHRAELSIEEERAVKKVRAKRLKAYEKARIAFLKEVQNIVSPQVIANQTKIDVNTVIDWYYKRLNVPSCLAYFAGSRNHQAYLIYKSLILNEITMPSDVLTESRAIKLSKTCSQLEAKYNINLK